MKGFKNFQDWERSFGNSQQGHVSQINSTKLFSIENPIFDHAPNHKTILRKVGEIETSNQPKHISTNGKYIAVTCLTGECVNIYNKNFELIHTLGLQGKAIEAKFIKRYLLITISDLAKNSTYNKLAIVDLQDFKTITFVNTYGQWSKNIIKHPTKPYIYISNWQSNTLSTIDISDIKHARCINTTQAGISPREGAVKNNKLFIAGYYSRNLIEFSIKEAIPRVQWIGPPYDFPHYSGNMRSIIIIKNKAYISNMGRNKILVLDLKTRKIIAEKIIGKFPTSLITNNKYLITSCTGSNRIFLLNKDTLDVKGVSPIIKKGTFGLLELNDYIISVSLEENVMEIWQT